MNPALGYELLERAMTEELGLVVGTNNPHQMSARLLAVRKDFPQFAEIEITVPSTPNTVMLVKKTVELDEPVWDEPSLELSDE